MNNTDTGLMKWKRLEKMIQSDDPEKRLSMTLLVKQPGEFNWRNYTTIPGLGGLTPFRAAQKLLLERGYQYVNTDGG